MTYQNAVRRPLPTPEQIRAKVAAYERTLQLVKTAAATRRAAA